ncbi:MAG: gliding motility-associated C-terminal domain-containing protein [Chitinophagales bacterium]|nr:gliding motility-associated C-terminal domain-containing protein [Chitinophagales bacterium]
MDLGSSIRACEGKFIELAATKNLVASYLWNNGDTTDAITVSTGGTFSCTVTNTCGSAEDAVEIIFIDCSNCTVCANVFSPNNDGSNDFFQVYSNCPLVSFRLKIFNRWDEKIFEATNENNRWDGYYKGILQEAGIYIYTLSLTNEIWGKHLTQKAALL